MRLPNPFTYAEEAAKRQVGYASITPEQHCETPADTPSGGVIIVPPPGDESPLGIFGVTPFGGRFVFGRRTQ